MWLSYPKAVAVAVAQPFQVVPERTTEHYKVSK